jgi:cytoskeletal protein CcmA (bactofilin family)
MTFQEKVDPPVESIEKAARLGPSLLFQGEIAGKEDFVVQGQFRGKINLPDNDLLITEHGKTEAEIHIRNITIRGEVIGNIHASGRIVIEKTGRMRGDLAASVISIEDGAQFKGSVKIHPKK